jgi:hypothetical protein
VSIMVTEELRMTAKKHSDTQRGALNPVVPIVIIALAVFAAVGVFFFRNADTKVATVPQNSISPTVYQPSPSVTITPATSGSTGGTNIGNQSLDQLDQSLETQLNALDVDAKGIDQGLTETPADLSN